MAKFIKSTLPKIISRANKDISAIIESDLVSESNLLKKLVDHVAKSNKKIAKERDKRMQETRDKIDHYDAQVAKLNQEIDAIDHETLIRQLNQMLKTKDDVFHAKQALRFYEASKSPKTIALLQDQTKQIQEDLIQAFQAIANNTSDFTSSANQLYTYIHHQAKQITNNMVDEYIAKMESICQETASLDELKSNLFKHEKSIEAQRNTLLKTLDEESIIKNLTLYDASSDEEIDQQIESEFSKKKEAVEKAISSLEENYNLEQRKIKDDFFKYEQELAKELHEKHQEQIASEAAMQEDIKEELKNIKFSIMEAEKKENYRQVKSLIRQYEKVEQSLHRSQSAKVEEELDRLTSQKHEETLQKLYVLEQSFIKEKMDKELELALLNIYHSQDKHNFLMQSDYEQLQKDQETFKDLFANIKGFYAFYKEAKMQTIKQRYDIRIVELDILKKHEQSKLSFIKDLEDLMNTLSKQLNEYMVNIQRLEEEKYAKIVDAIYHIKQSLLKIDFEKQLITIDHRIMNRQNERLIQSEKEQDEREQKVIALEAQIEVALKEKELQLIKVKSLYEYEKRLAEEQVSRISGGIDVNDAFVKTTLENQLLFAEQQIKCAHGEYDIRLESIALTKEQETSYAMQKLEQYKHHYDQEIEKLEQIKKDKLEDLDYKMMLFTSASDQRKFVKQKEELQEDIQEKIEDIQKRIQEDERITRYQQMIDKANSRFEKAKSDAEQLRDQTIQSFQQLYDKTKEKYDDLEETSHSEESKNLTPVLNNQALSKAHERLEQATKEAEDFYQERIKEPTALIEQYNQEIASITTSYEDDEFIIKQTALKEELKEEFLSNEEAIKQIASEEKAQFQVSMNQKSLTPLEKTDFVRSEADIEDNYKDLVSLEEKRMHEEEKEFDHVLRNELQTIDKTINHYDTTFQSLIKGYKSYLKMASRGIQKQVKEVKKESLKQRKAALADAKKNVQLKKA